MALKYSWTAIYINTIYIPFDSMVTWIIKIHWHCIVIIIEHSSVHESAVMHSSFWNLKYAVIIIK